MLEHVLLVLALIGFALLLGACVFESVVVAPNNERDIPASLGVAREYFSLRNGGHFFRVVSPATLLLVLACVVVSWPQPMVRGHTLLALGLLVLTDVITFTFHYPRLAIMFKGPLTEDPARLRRAAREWALGNAVRAVLLLLAFLAILHAVLGAHAHHGA